MDDRIERFLGRRLLHGLLHTALDVVTLRTKAASDIHLVAPKVTGSSPVGHQGEPSSWSSGLGLTDSRDSPTFR